MNLSRPARIALIAATLAMPLYVLFFMVSMFANFRGTSADSFIFGHFGLFFAIHAGMMLLQFALITFYVVYLFKTSRVPSDQKALWAVVLFMGGPIAMPIFWYLHIWREPQVAVR